MASRPRAALGSVIGWIIVILIAFWALGFVIGWIGFVLRSIGLLLVIVLLVVAYLAVKGPPDD